MAIIKITGLILSLILVLSGCSGIKEIPLCYDDSAFECEISWSFDTERFRAVLSVGVPSELGAERDVSVSFCEPQSLCGVVARRESGVVTLTLGELEMPEVHLSGIFEVAELFVTDGKILSSTLTKEGSESLNLIILERESGERLDIYLSSDGLPRKISGNLCGKNTELYVLWFEKK